MGGWSSAISLRPFLHFLPSVLSFRHLSVASNRGCRWGSFCMLGAFCSGPHVAFRLIVDHGAFTLNALISVAAGIDLWVSTGLVVLHFYCWKMPYQGVLCVIYPRRLRTTLASGRRHGYQTRYIHSGYCWPTARPCRRTSLCPHSAINKLTLFTFFLA